MGLTSTIGMCYHTSAVAAQLAARVGVLEEGALLPGLYEGGNRLLDALPAERRIGLTLDLRVVNVDRREHATEAGVVFEHVDFPIDAVYSIVASDRHGEIAEVGTVGREGFVPAQLAVGSMLARRTTTCQIGGRVARMPVPAFRHALETDVIFSEFAHRNIDARLFAAEQLNACNLMHSVIERVARWLLITRDRVGRDEFPLTHDFLATMLGVRRAGVTQAAGSLQQAEAITYRRGQVTVRDPERLERAACDCYRATREVYEAALAGTVVA